MTSGEEGAEDEGDDASPDPSVSDLAERVDPDAGSDEAHDSSRDEELPPTFADLLGSIRGGAIEGAGSTDAGSGADKERSEDGNESDPSEVPIGGDGWVWQQGNAGRSENEGDSTPGAGTPSPSTLGDETNVLVVGDLQTGHDYDVCTALLGAEAPTNLLLVTLTQTPDERLSVIRSRLGTLPRRTAVINVGDSVRSGGGNSSTRDGSGSITIDSIADAGDLMRIGITTSRRISEFEDAGGPTAVCFHSLTALLQFVENQQVLFRFLHTLRGRIRAAEAHAHYHIDASAHENQVLALLRPLFDVTLYVDEAGNVDTRKWPP